MRKFAKVLAATFSFVFLCSVFVSCGGGTDSSSDSGGESTSQTTPEEVYYTVTYDADGGSLDGEASVQVEKGKSITLPSAEKQDFELSGWYDGETLAGAAGESYTPSGDVTLKAHWESALPDYAAVNEARAIEYGKLIKELYWNSETKLSNLTPGGGVPFCWPFTEQLSMVNGILLTMDETHEDYEFFSNYLVELIEGMRHYRVKIVNMSDGESWENPDYFIAEFGENDGSANSYAIYNSGRNDGAVDSVSAGLDGIFFDDNVWVAKEFYYAYINLGDVKYLNESINILNWIVGEGYEETKGLNGIYWKWAAKFKFEDKAGGGGLDDNNHASLNACSSAPTAMMLVKLYNAMGDESLNGKFETLRTDYLAKAQNIYEFCYSVLRNPESGCLRDKIFLKEGFENMTDQNQQIQLVDQQELAYNTGTFMTAGAELYNQAVAAGKDAVAEVYLGRNEQVAEDADRKFANTQVVEGQYSYGNHSWFTSFLLEGFIDLSDTVPACAEYIEHMRSSLDYAWNNNRAEDKLVSPAWIEGWDSFSDNGVNSEGNPRQILLQSANAHCYAMLARYYA